jgi:hypothetical protein
MTSVPVAYISLTAWAKREGIHFSYARVLAKKRLIPGCYKPHTSRYRGCKGGQWRVPVATVYRRRRRPHDGAPPAGWLRTYEVARLVHRSPRQIGLLLDAGKIEGAMLMGDRWLIPDTAKVPVWRKVMVALNAKKTLTLTWE